MSGRAAERMRRVLNGTGCYRLTGETSADWETNACGTGIDLVEDAAEALLRDLSPATAAVERLDAWEALFRPQPSSETAEVRREMAKERLSMNPGRFAPEDFSPMLKAAGLRGEVKETTAGLRVLVGRLLGLTETEVRRELDEILPAHLTWELVEAVNWVALDAWAAPFGELDGYGLTWETFDRLTLAQLKNLGTEESEDGVNE